MAPDSFAVFSSNFLYYHNADSVVPFQQNSNFYYLAGIDQENCYLIISKILDINDQLYIPFSNKHSLVWEGQKLSLEQAGNISGIEEVFFENNFWKNIKSIGLKADKYYFQHDPVLQDLYPFENKHLTEKKKIYKRLPHLKLESSFELMKNLRLIKSEEEIKKIKQAIAITRGAFLSVLAKIKYLKYEFEVEAEISHYFTSNRSRFHSFPPIVAGGANATVLHYISNNDMLQNGDLLLVDFGAEYANYRADITRVIPISGKFSDRQKQVYEGVKKALFLCQNLYQPGEVFENIRSKAKEILGNILVELGLTQGNFATSDEIQLYTRHGIGHFLGLDTHDIGDNKSILSPGMVLTCEPGIYIPTENIGIRLENDILITERGNINLSEGIPIEIPEIEHLYAIKI